MAIDFVGAEFTPVYAPPPAPGYPATIDYTLDTPAGVSVGDLLIACVPSFTFDLQDGLAGWTRLTPASNQVLHLWWKWAEAGDPSSWTWTNLSSGASPCLGCIACYSGNIDQASPIEGYALVPFPLLTASAVFSQTVPTVSEPDAKIVSFTATRRRFTSPGTWTDVAPTQGGFTERGQLFDSSGGSTTQHNTPLLHMVQDRDGAPPATHEVTYDAPLAGAGATNEFNLYGTVAIRPGPPPPDVIGVSPGLLEAVGTPGHIIIGDEGESI